MLLFIVVAIIIVALIFDFLNGFHDAANSIATMSCHQVTDTIKAVLWAAFFNFIAAFGMKVYVANTIAKGIIDIDKIVAMFPPIVPAEETKYFLATVVLAELCGAIAWNIITWYFGLPTSSSHALIGRFVGAACRQST
jgi:PiT family inorganic phosphate transporter